MVNRTARHGIQVKGSDLENAELGIVAERKSPMDRLGKRVVIMGDCWVVDGEPDKYHHVHVGGGASMSAHRYVYQEVHDTALLSFVHVHHTCEVKGCIRPDHLRALYEDDHVRHHRGDEVRDARTMMPPEWHNPRPE